MDVCPTLEHFAFETAGGGRGGPGARTSLRTKENLSAVGAALCDGRPICDHGAGDLAAIATAREKFRLESLNPGVVTAALGAGVGEDALVEMRRLLTNPADHLVRIRAPDACGSEKAPSNRLFL